MGAHGNKKSPCLTEKFPHGKIKKGGDRWSECPWPIGKNAGGRAVKKGGRFRKNIPRSEKKLGVG